MTQQMPQGWPGHWPLDSEEMWAKEEQERQEHLRFIRFLRMWLRFTTAFLVAAVAMFIALLLLSGCADDRDTVNARVDNVFKVVDAIYQDDDDCLDCPRILIKVSDLDEGGEFTWEGRINEGVHKLEIINVGECYRRPLQDSAEKVSCSEHE